MANPHTKIETALLDEANLGSIRSLSNGNNKPGRVSFSGDDDTTDDDYTDDETMDKPTGLSARFKSTKKLTAVSAMYDLDGDGVLDEAEQAMRDRDLSGRGYLTNEEIYAITREQLAAKQTAKHMKKAIAGLVCFVFILALSNLGTSFASAILAKETKTNSESSAMEIKATGETVGMQLTGETFEIDELEYEERRQRRAMVLEEMEDDPLHSDHAHRRLGKNKNTLCGCNKIAFDSGKVAEKDVLVLKAKCDGTRTVNIKRKWKDGSSDMDTLCGPGVTISVKGKKKKSKNKNKVRIVDQEIVFEQKNEKNKGKGKAVFSCERGWCYTSGERFLQAEGEPCDLTHGSDDCLENLQCYSDDIRDLVGRCTRMVNLVRTTDEIVVNTVIDADNIGGWYVDHGTNEGDQCVRDCDVDIGVANCGGLRQKWQQEFLTSELCCKHGTGVGWKRFEDCVRDWPQI